MEGFCPCACVVLLVLFSGRIPCSFEVKEVASTSDEKSVVVTRDDWPDLVPLLLCFELRREDSSSDDSSASDSMIVDYG